MVRIAWLCVLIGAVAMLPASLSNPTAKSTVSEEGSGIAEQLLEVEEKNEVHCKVPNLSNVEKAELESVNVSERHPVIAGDTISHNVKLVIKSCGAEFRINGAQEARCVHGAWSPSDLKGCIQKSPLGVPAEEELIAVTAPIATDEKLNQKEIEDFNKFLTAIRNGESVNAGSIFPDVKDINARSPVTFEIPNTPALIIAAMNGKAPSTVKFLLENGAHVDATRHEDDATALIVASELGHLDNVEILIKVAKADLEKKSKNGETALLAAARNGHEKVVRFLMGNRADSSKCDLELCKKVKLEAERKERADALAKFLTAVSNGEKDATAAMAKNKPELLSGCDADVFDGKNSLMVAISNVENSEMAKHLMSLDDELIIKTDCKNAKNALHVAGEVGNIAMIKFLLNMGAKTDVKTSTGHTALTLAIENNHQEAATELIQRGADCPAPAIESCTNKWNDVVLQKLLDAVRTGGKSTVEAIISRKGINASWKNAALLTATEHGFMDVVTYMLDNEADVNALSWDETKSTALMVAIVKNRPEVFKHLLTVKRLDVNVKNADGENAMQVAVEENKSEFWRGLVEAFAETLEKCTGEKCLPAAKHEYQLFLQKAVDDNKISILKFLIDNVLAQDAEFVKSLLSTAISKGNLDITKLILQADSTLVNTDLPDGSLPLTKAIEVGNENMVQLLLELGANANGKLSNGDSALMVAVKGKRSKIAKIIFQKSGSNEFSCTTKQCFEVLETEPMPVLRKALALDKQDVIDKLAAEYGLAKVTDNDQNTILMIALKAKDTVLIEKLTAMASAIDLVNQPNAAGEKPLELAVGNDDEATIRFLLNHNADATGCKHRLCVMRHQHKLILAARDGKISEIDEAIAAGANVDFCDPSVENGRTAFIAAIEAKQHEVAEHLITLRTDITHQACNGEASNPTTLLLAVENDMGDIALQILAKSDAALVEAKNANKDTAIVVAGKKKQLELVKQLEERGADTQYCRVKTCLKAFAMNAFAQMSMAIANDNAYIIDQMLDDGFDLSQLSESDPQDPILHIAVALNKLETVEKLIKRGANVNQQAKSNKATALHVATERHNLHIVALLLDNGADINAQEYRGFTPLIMAVLSGRLRTVRFLINKGAKVDMQTEVKLATALTLASRDGHVNIVKLILSKNKDAAFVDHSDYKGRTALIRAATSAERAHKWWEREEAIKTMVVLLQHGADTNGCEVEACNVAAGRAGSRTGSA